MKNCRIIDIDGKTIIKNGMIAVDKGIISYIGKEKNLDSEKIIDLKHHAVLPNLINSHTHVSMTIFQGYAKNLLYNDWFKKIQEAEKKLTPSDIRRGAEIGIREMIKTGTTAFVDMYFYMDEVAEVVKKTGIRAALGYGIIEGINEDIDTKLKNRQKFVKKWRKVPNITTMYCPHSVLSCSKATLEKINELAIRDNTWIHMHVLETKHELLYMKKKYGMSSIEYLDELGIIRDNFLAAHCVWLSDKDIDILKKRNATVVHCPSSNLSLGTGIADVRKLLKKGVKVALGTDGSSGFGLNMWNEMKVAVYVSKLKHPNDGLSEYEVLKMATASQFFQS